MSLLRAVAGLLVVIVHLATGTDGAGEVSERLNVQRLRRLKDEPAGTTEQLISIDDDSEDRREKKQDNTKAEDKDEAKGEKLKYGVEERGEHKGEEKGKESGEEAGAEEEEEGEEEEIDVSRSDFCMALMLLGFITFVMSLFTMVNHEDEDMRFYTWSVISSTISIFVAVLMFSSINALLHEVVLREQPEVAHNAVDFAQMIFYLLLLQIATALLSGAWQEEPIKRGRTQLVKGDNVEVTIEDQKQQIERIMRCWAHLLSHMAGFAQINFGGVLQQSELFSGHPLLTVLVVPLMLGANVLAWLFFSSLRDRIFLHHIQGSNGSANPVEVEDVDEYLEAKDSELQEKRLGELQKRAKTSGVSQAALDDALDAAEPKAAIIELIVKQDSNPKEEMHKYVLQKYEETVVDAMQDVASLCVSFLIVQACRFNISGVLPNTLGIEEADYHHNLHCTLGLLFAATFFAICTVVLVCVTSVRPEGEAKDHKENISLRIICVLQCSCAMSMAWCLLYAIKWETTRSFPPMDNPNAFLSRLMTAVTISLVAFFVISILDMIADSSLTGEKVDMAIIQIISAISILVGFSWEQCFDGGVEVIAAKTPEPWPVYAELAIATFVALLVITPWRRYILQKVIILERDREAKVEMESKAESVRSSFSPVAHSTSPRIEKIISGIASPALSRGSSPSPSLLLPTLLRGKSTRRMYAGVLNIGDNVDDDLMMGRRASSPTPLRELALAEGKDISLSPSDLEKRLKNASHFRKPNIPLLHLTKDLSTTF